jgi:hypothetical protein
MSALGSTTVPDPTATPANSKTSRDGKGRFGKGNPGGPGNPHSKRIAQLRKLLLEQLGDDDLQVIAGKLIELAKEGELAAIKLLFQYTLGKPGSFSDFADFLDEEESPQTPPHQPLPSANTTAPRPISPEEQPLTGKKPPSGVANPPRSTEKKPAGTTTRLPHDRFDLIDRIAESVSKRGETVSLIGMAQPKANGG